MAIVLSHLDSPILMVLQTLQQVAIWVGHTAYLASGDWTRWLRGLVGDGVLWRMVSCGGWCIVDYSRQISGPNSRQLHSTFDFPVVKREGGRLTEDLGQPIVPQIPSLRRPLVRDRPAGGC